LACEAAEPPDVDADVADPVANAAPPEALAVPDALEPDAMFVVCEAGPVGPDAPPFPLEELLLEVGLDDAAPLVPPCADTPVVVPPLVPDVEFPVAVAVDPPLDPPAELAFDGPVEPLVSATCTAGGGGGGGGVEE
jgi:hypothetical protein